MQRKSKSLTRGFTLLEMMVAMALGLLVVGAAVQLFSRGLDATWTISQKAQMQQDVRAGSNMLTKDLSMAGAGLNPGGIGLISGASGTPKYGCDYAGTCYINGGAGINFPCIGSSCAPTMYYVLPGYAKGKIVTTGQPATDVITVAYLDNDFLLNKYTVTFTGSVAKFTMPSPVPSPTPQAVTDTAVGLQLGDLVLFSSSNSSGSTAYAIGEVTNTAGSSSPYSITFATTDPMHVNQSLTAVSSGSGIQASRIWLITYYLDVMADPSGSGAGTPRLMRQVNGRKPVPVAENVSDMHFTYDIYDDSSNPPYATSTVDANLSTGSSPNLIRKINVKHLTFRSLLAGTKGYQGYDMATSVSARNLGFSDRYPIQ